MATVMPAFQVPGVIDPVKLSFLEWLESEEQTRQANYVTFRDYYDGDHLSLLTARMRRFLELRQDQQFNLNFCPIVVDSLAEKLKVAGFECDSDQETLTEWWDLNRMDGMQAVAHLAAVRDGDTYVLVEWDNDEARPRFAQENAYDGTQGVHVVYSDEDHDCPLVAIKRWTMTSGPGISCRRVNLYFEDRIEKYTDGGNTGGSWQQHMDEGQAEWPIWWTEGGVEGGVPLGIPVIHFRNKDQGYSYGESELNDVTPVQNGLNKTFIDLLAAADTTGFRNYTMTGGDPSDITTAPGSWLYATDPAAKISASDAADLSGLMDLKDSIAADIAKITRTPLSYFQLTGQVAAGDTLKEQRQGLTSKARDRQTTFGNCWEDVLYMGRKLCQEFGPGIDQTQSIRTLWEDDEKPDLNELADTVDKLNRAAAASTETKVKILHPEWDVKEIAAEVALIQKEQGMAVPTLPPVG